MKEDSEEPGSMGSILKDAGRSAVNEAKSTFKWLLGGAAVGALIVGGAGGFFLGWTGLGYGLIAGAVIGAFVTLWLMAEM